jgi:hypothetical protein
MGSVRVTKDLTGSIAIAGDFAGSMTIGGNLASDSLNAINIGGSVPAGSAITIQGSASYGAGSTKNRIRIGGSLNRTIQVVGGQFGDVVVVDTINSAGMLWSTGLNGLAKIFATNPNNMTYFNGATTGPYTLLFGLTGPPV